MDKASNGGAAFPSHGSMGEVTHEGATLRDYFAAKAMQALLHPTHFVALSEMSPGESHVGRVAKEAYWTADAMLAARGAP